MIKNFQTLSLTFFIAILSSYSYAIEEEKKDSFIQERKNALKKNLKKRKKYKKVKKKYQKVI